MINRSILIGAALLAIARPCPGLEIMLTGIVTSSRISHIIGDPAEIRIEVLADHPGIWTSGISVDVEISGRTFGDNGWIAWEPAANGKPYLAHFKFSDVSCLASPPAGLFGDVISMSAFWFRSTVREYDAAGLPTGWELPDDPGFHASAGCVDWFQTPSLDDIPSYIPLPRSSFGRTNTNAFNGFVGRIEVIGIQFLHDELPGDANRDGVFDRFDLVEVQHAGKYETNVLATWSQGDWNADGYFNNRDLIAALAEPSPVAIPEASGLCLAIFAMLFLLRIRPWFDQRWPCNA